VTTAGPTSETTSHTHSSKGQWKCDAVNEIKYIDLFAGVGGFHKGLQQANESVGNNKPLWENSGQERNLINPPLPKNKQCPSFHCVWANEWDKHASKVYKARFPETPFFEGDIRTVNPDRLPDFNLLCGGFPCQSFSLAGKRKGFNDTRGTLFFEIAHILKTKRPQTVLLENVKGLLSHENGATFGRIIQILGELGYWVEWQVLNSKNFGVPQNRERVFIAGHLGKGSGRQIFPLRQNGCQPNRKESYVSSCLDGNYHKGSSRGFGGQARQLITEGGGLKQIGLIGKVDTQSHRVYSTEGNASCLSGESGGVGAKTGLYAIPCLTPNRENKRQNGRRFKEEGDPMFTLTGQDIHGVALNNRIRRLTPKECERLQGFPDNWTLVDGMSDTQRYKMMGNAVTVNVIEALGKAIQESDLNG